MTTKRIRSQPPTFYLLLGYLELTSFARGTALSLMQPGWWSSTRPKTWNVSARVIYMQDESLKQECLHIFCSLWNGIKAPIRTECLLRFSHFVDSSRRLSFACWIRTISIKWDESASSANIHTFGDTNRIWIQLSHSTGNRDGLLLLLSCVNSMQTLFIHNIH